MNKICVNKQKKGSNNNGKIVLKIIKLNGNFLFSMAFYNFQKKYCNSSEISI